jgi:hypothetical protein
VPSRGGPSTYFGLQAFPNRQYRSGPRLGFFGGWHIRDQRLGASVGVDYLGVRKHRRRCEQAGSFRSLAPPSGVDYLGVGNVVGVANRAGVIPEPRPTKLVLAR